MWRLLCDYHSQSGQRGSKADRSTVKGGRHENVVTWHERPAASSGDYEAAQERVLAIFKDWQTPASLTIQQFVVRVGEFGGYMIVETDQPTDIHYFTTVFAVFEFKVEPVVDVMDAVAVEVRAIEYRKKNAP